MIKDNILNREHVSFSEFVDGKETLLRAASKPPIRTCDYNIIKYLKIPVITEDAKIEISLKPKDVVKVKWLCETEENPIALRVEINGNPARINFSGKKLLNWLNRYSK